MIAYRPFRNTDPPAIVEIWNAQPPQRGLAAPMSVDLFERMVLSKPYFDRHGLIVAVDETSPGQRPIAFAHAGFGAAADGGSLSRAAGACCLVLSLSHPEASAIRAELVARCERYLTAAGAKTLYGGACAGCDAFYLGLYGGAQAPGVLQSDVTAIELFRGAGYRESRRVIVLQRRLSGFRPLIDRRQMQIRRTHRLEVTLDPPSDTWWQACTLGAMDRTLFTLYANEGGPPLGKALFWDMEPLASSWGAPAMGVSQFEITAEKRRQGLGLFLLGEAMRQLQTHGAAIVEGHVDVDDAVSLKWLAKLGYEEVDRGVLFEKVV